MCNFKVRGVITTLYLKPPPMPQGSYLHQAMLSAPEKSAPSRRIEILRTEGEWSAISHLLADQKHCDLHAYLHREISRLTNKFGECEVCITPADGIMKTFRHNIPTHI